MKKLSFKILIISFLIVLIIGIFLEFFNFADFFEIDELARGYKMIHYDGIIIVGSDDFNNKTNEALKYIKENDRENYNFVKRNIAKIKYKGSSGVNFLFKTFFVGPTYKKSLKWYSSAIIHDACHVDQFRRLILPWGKRAEKMCMEKQNEFLFNISYPPVDIEKKLKTKYWWKIFRDW